MALHSIVAFFIHMGGGGGVLGTIDVFSSSTIGLFLTSECESARTIEHPSREWEYFEIKNRFSFGIDSGKSAKR